MNSTRFLRFTLASICGLAGLRSAVAESYYADGLYGWYEGGPALVEDAKIEGSALRNSYGFSVNGNNVKFDTGFHFGLGIGQELTRFLRVELESGFNYNSLRSIEDADASSGNIYRVPSLITVIRKRCIVCGPHFICEWFYLATTLHDCADIEHRCFLTVFAPRHKRFAWWTITNI